MPFSASLILEVSAQVLPKVPTKCSFRNEMKWNIFFFSEIYINLQEFQVIPENKTQVKFIN